MKMMDEIEARQKRIRDNVEKATLSVIGIVVLTIALYLTWWTPDMAYILVLWHIGFGLVRAIKRLGGFEND